MLRCTTTLDGEYSHLAIFTIWTYGNWAIYTDAISGSGEGDRLEFEVTLRSVLRPFFGVTTVIDMRGGQRIDDAPSIYLSIC